MKPQGPVFETLTRPESMGWRRRRARAIVTSLLIDDEMTSAEEAARYARFPGYDPDWPVCGRQRHDDPGDYHYGHVSHMHGSHGGGIECSCGATLGVVCFVPAVDDDGHYITPPPCPECVRVGRVAVSLDRAAPRP